MPKPCMICGGMSSSFLYRLPNVLVLECPDCGLAYVDEAFSQSQMRELYNAENYYEEEFTFFVPDVEEKILQDNLQAFASILRYVSGGKILDLGCANGAFLGRLDPGRWERHGIDMSERAIESARRNARCDGVIFRCGELHTADYPDAAFDVVTLWMVIEHLQDPAGVLREVNRILRPGGIMVLKTPNRHSLLAHLADWLYRLSRRRIVRPISLYYTPLHLYFFEPITLSRMLEMTGFQTVESWQEERYVTKHALSCFPAWQRPVLRFVVALSKILGLMDACVLYGQKK